MPRLSDTMSEGAVGKWLKQPGDRIESGEIIAEIETDKATMDLEAFESGTLQQILVPEGQTVPIGEPIAIVGDGPAGPAGAAGPAARDSAGSPAAARSPSSPGQPAALPAAGAPEEASGAVVAPVPGAAAQGAAPSGNGERIKASPVARRLAEERGIDLRQVTGSGPGGRIIKENVEEFRAPPATRVAAQ